MTDLVNVGAYVGDPSATPNRDCWIAVNAEVATARSLRSRTITVGDKRFDGAATSGARVQLAVAQALLELASLVHVGLEFIPYDISEVTSLAAFHAAGGRLVREGGDYSVFDFRAYGAAGDGVTNDYAAIQIAWNASALQGNTAWIPPGRFRVLTKLLVPTNLECAGVGAGSVFFFDWFGNSGIGSGGDVYLENADTTNGNTGMRLHDFAIEGANTSGLPTGLPVGGTAGGINFRRGSDIDITRLRITKIPGISISYQGVSQIRIVGNYVSQGGHDGITGGPFGSSPCEDVVIANNTLRELGDDGIAVNASVDQVVYGTTRPTRVAITGNTIFLRTAAGVTNAAGRGILLNGVENFTVTGNVIANTFASGIHLQADSGLSGFTCREGTITGNTVESAGQTGDGSQPQVGIRILGTTDTSVVANVVTDAKTNGILVSDTTDAAQVCSGLLINSNIVKGCGTTASSDTAIHLDARIANGIQHVVISSNKVSGNASGGIGVRSANHVLIIGNHCTNNGTIGGHSGAEAGIWLGAAGGLSSTVTVRGNYCTDTQTTKTQTSGVCFHNLGTAVTHATIEDNYLKTNFNNGTNGEVLINLAPTALVYRRDDLTPFTLTDAATIAVNALVGAAVSVTITANRTVGAPTNPSLGQRMHYTIIQDGTGGWTLAWNAVFKVSWSDTGNTLNKRSTIAFVYNGTNWNQDGAQTPYV